MLETLSSDPSITQRGLAKELRVALGLTNLMIRRLAQKGLLELVNVRKNRIRYLLTPKGLAEKSRLTSEFLEYSLHLYRRVREVVKSRLTDMGETGGRRVVIVGTDEVAEIAYLTLKELSLELVGVVADQPSKNSFLGIPVTDIETLAGLQFDCALVTSFPSGAAAFRERIRGYDIPEAKCIVIERHGAKIHAVTAGVGI